MIPTSGPTLRRALLGLGLAAAAAIVLALRVEPGVERIRYRIVRSPHAAAGTSLVVPLPPMPRLVGTRAAVVVRLIAGASPARVTISLDGEPIGTALVEAGHDQRSDWTVQVPEGSGHAFAFAGDSTGWSVSYFEMANIHGFSRGLIDFAIVPDSRPRLPMGPGWMFGLFALGLLAISPRPDWPARRALRIAHRAAAALVLLSFAAVLAAEWLSRFAVVLSLHTFLLGAAVLYADPVLRLTAATCRAVRRAAIWVAGWPWKALIVRLKAVLPVLPHVLVAATFLWCVTDFYEPAFGFTRVIRFGDSFTQRALPALAKTPHAVEHGWGYDGQWYAQLALDPLMRSDRIKTALDSPAYRARRPLFPALAWVAGLGQPAAVLQAYALLNVAAWLALAVLLLRWLPPGSARNFAAWSACMLNIGLLGSVHSALVDGPSLLVLALAVAALERGRTWRTVAIVAVSGLGRETNLLASTLFWPARWDPKSIGQLAVRGAAAALPLAAWLAYLTTRDLPSDLGGLRNAAWPLTAWVWKWRTTLAAFAVQPDHYLWSSILSGASLTVQAAVLWVRRDWTNAWWRLGATYAVFGLVLGPAVWEGHPGAVVRVLLPMTAAYNIVITSSRWCWPLLVLGNLAFIHGLQFIRFPWLPW